LAQLRLALSSVMANVVFRCPRTGMNVQMWLNENNPPLPDQTFESLVCPACTGLHFIDVSTGKILGSKAE
jgi:hypothetical protein